MKLVGKMCKKREDSKYFGAHLPEDSRMVCTAKGEHGITCGERAAYEPRFAAFRAFVMREGHTILKVLGKC